MAYIMEGAEPGQVFLSGNGRQRVLQELHGPEGLLFKVGGKGSPDHPSIAEWNKPFLSFAEKAHAFDKPGLAKGIELSAHAATTGSR